MFILKTSVLSTFAPSLRAANTVVNQAIYLTIRMRNFYSKLDPYFLENVLKLNTDFVLSNPLTYIPLEFRKADEKTTFSEAVSSQCEMRNRNRI